jgi:hypothetical protein
MTRCTASIGLSKVDAHSSGNTFPVPFWGCGCTVSSSSPMYQVSAEPYMHNFSYSNVYSWFIHLYFNILSLQMQDKSTQQLLGTLSVPVGSCYIVQGRESPLCLITANWSCKRHKDLAPMSPSHCSTRKYWRWEIVVQTTPLQVTSSWLFAVFNFCNLFWSILEPDEKFINLRF